MAALAAFYPFIMPQVPGVPDPTLEQVTRMACIEFCRRTLISQALVPVSIANNVQDYTITVPTDMTLVNIRDVWYGNSMLRPYAIEQVRAAVALVGPVGTAEPASGTSYTFFQKVPNSTQVSLYPIPAEDVSNGLTVRADFAPTMTAATVDDVLFNEWVEAIAAGALHRLFSMKGAPWTDPEAAGMNRGVFEVAVGRARNIARLGRVSASSRVVPRRFA